MLSIVKYCVLASALVAAPAFGADAGRIKNVSGPVHIERGGERIAAAVGAGVQASDTIVTGNAAAVGITFADDSRIAAGPNTTLVLSRYRFDPATHGGVMDTMLKRGTLAVVSGRLAKHSHEAVAVRTPEVVLGVRGTEFVVHAE